MTFMLLQNLLELPLHAAIGVVVTLGLTVLGSIFFIKVQHIMERDQERALAEMCRARAALDEALASAAAPLPTAGMDCAVCGAFAPVRCKGCQARAYCGPQCQLKDWRSGHKQQCKKLRAQLARGATEATGAAAGAAGAQQQGAASAESASAPPGAPGAAASSSGGSSNSSSRGSAPAPPSVDSNTLAPIPSRVIYPYDRFRQLLAAPPTRRAPCGLVNTHNTCFANSLLQALLATPPLAAYLVAGEHSEECEGRGARGGFCLLCDLEELAKQAYQGGSGSSGRAPVLNPKQMLRNIKRIGRQFTFGHQEDSHELYVQALDCMEAAMLAAAGGKEQFDQRSRETTLVHHLFGGYLRNQVECLACGHVSKSYESCCGLELEVPYRAASLEAALAHFTACERLDGANKYQCDKCKTKVAADLGKKVEVAPNVLQICLKRFMMGRFVGKMKQRISFPEHLDMEPYMAADSVDEQPAQYSLYGVVVHQGSSTHYGHYVSYVRVGDKWFSCNDESVTQVAAHVVLKESAYQLFYQRHVPRDVPAKPAGATSRAATPKAATPRAAALASAGPSGEYNEPMGAAVLGRIQTAPAALSHMSAEAAPSSSSLAGLAGAAALSASPSAGALADREGEPPAVLLSDLHPSVSESALQLGDGGGSGGNSSGHHSRAEAAAAAAGGESLPAAAAAVAAAAVAADGERAGSGEQVVEEFEDEGDSEEEHLAPAANPFELLAGSEDEGPAAHPPSQLPSEQEAAGNEHQEPQPAAHVSSQPEADSSGSASSPRAGSSVAQPGPAAAQEAAPCEARQPGPEQCGCCEREGGSAAARLASGDLQQQHHHHHQPAQQQLQQHGGEVEPAGPSSGGGGGSSYAGERVPSYRLEQKQLDDGTDVIRLSVDLPGACGEHIDLRVSEDRRQLWLHAAPFGTTVPLPSAVEPIQRSVKWVKKSERLVAMFNVAAPAEE